MESLWEIAAALRREVASVELEGARWLHSLKTVAAVVLAVLAALALHTGNPWWAAVSAYRVTQIDLTASLQRGVMRILGTFLGAVVGLVLLHFFAYQQLPMLIALFAVGWLGLFGAVTRPHGYAWLFFGITADMVMLSALDQPETAYTFAYYRVIEVALGTGAAMLVGTLFPGGVTLGAPAPAAAAPASDTTTRSGFEERLRNHWPAIMHACRGGLTIMLLPIVWNLVQLNDLAQMAITAVAVMVVPLETVQKDDREFILRRAVHRVVGCILGGLAGLFCVQYLSADFLPWILSLVAGVWIGSQIETGKKGVSYVGVQAVIAFLMTLVQGGGPPLSLLPGIDRLTGIVIGLFTLFFVTLILSAFGESRKPAAAQT